MRATVAAALLLLATPAFANDSSAALGTGGLVLTKSADIAMRSEDLSISPKRVQVRYVFVNESGRDVDETIAFPLPDIDAEIFWEEAIGTMTDDPVNFVGFSLAVDGKPVHFSIEQKALLKGRDVSAAVRAAGLPVNIVARDGYKMLEALPASARADLKRAGLIEGQDSYIRPLWKITTSFYWRQHFPAGRSVTVEHSYQPVTGQSFFSRTDLDTPETLAYYRRDYCMDVGTEAFARKRLAQGTNFPGSDLGPGMLVAYSTDYVLTTANNWKGPIGRFRLTLDKLMSTNVLSLCWDGDLKKTGATRFEAVRKNFAPTRDIKMLVLE